MRRDRVRFRSFFSCCVLLGAATVLGGCPDDMREQPSFSYQEVPRLHSPSRSVPVARKILSPHVSEDVRTGARLFSINCSHCHGTEGMGDGPVAGFLPDLPANLQAPSIQEKSDEELYHVITNGEKVMPGFGLYLTPEERWALVVHVRSFATSPAIRPGAQDSPTHDNG